MRIVFLSYNYSAGVHTPEEWVQRINFYTGWAEELALTHTVIRVDQINYTGDFTHHGIQYHFVNDGRKKNYFPRRLNKYVKGLQPDIVLVSSFLFPVQLIQLRSCLGEKVKIIIQHHAEKPMTGYKKYIQRYAVGKADAWLFASSEIGFYWINKGNLPAQTKIHELMEVSSVFHLANKAAARITTGASGSPVFLWAGRLNENKDPLTAVKAFLQYHLLRPSAKLYMIYQSAELLPQIKQLLAAIPGESPVILTGTVAHAHMQDWYNSADFYLSASHYEGSGTALCEAMSCGCIPVVTNIPSFKKITLNGTHGFLYPPGATEILAALLQTAEQVDIDVYREKIEKHFRESFGFKSIARDFLRITDQL